MFNDKVSHTNYENDNKFQWEIEDEQQRIAQVKSIN